MATKVDPITGEVLKGNISPRFGTEEALRKRKMNSVHPLADENMAKQEFRKEADINHIMERYKATGLMPQQVANVQGHFADFTSVDDYYTACTQATNAQKAFDLLPSKLRKIFDNDPAKLVQFVSNPKNKVAAAKMGLLTKEATEKLNQELLNAKKQADEKVVAKAQAKVPKKDPEGS